MKKLILLLAIIAMVGGAFYTVNNYNKSNTNIKNSQKNSSNFNANNSTKNSNQNNTVKIKATDFKLKDLNGKELSLSDLKGKKVFLNFWATWCPPCKAEMPEIEQIYQNTKNSDLVIIAVEIGEPSSTVKSFIDENHYNFKVLLDSDKIVTEQYDINSIPSSFFIDKDGYIISKHIGAMDSIEMQNYIDSLDK